MSEHNLRLLPRHINCCSARSRFRARLLPTRQLYSEFFINLIPSEGDLSVMAKTTLSVRLVQVIQGMRRHSAFRLVVFSIFLITGIITAGCGSDGDGCWLQPSSSSCTHAASSPEEAGLASASLSWDPVVGVFGYVIHYGSQSPGSPGSCNYAQSMFTSTPAATVAGLAASTTYYFAVSSYNGVESACSAEVMTVTQSA